MLNTVKALVSRYPWEREKASVTGIGHFRECVKCKYTVPKNWIIFIKAAVSGGGGGGGLLMTVSIKKASDSIFTSPSNFTLLNPTNCVKKA